MTDIKRKAEEYANKHHVESERWLLKEGFLAGAECRPTAGMPSEKDLLRRLWDINHNTPFKELIRVISDAGKEVCKLRAEMESEKEKSFTDGILVANHGLDNYNCENCIAEARRIYPLHLSQTEKGETK